MCFVWKLFSSNLFYARITQEVRWCEDWWWLESKQASLSDNGWRCKRFSGERKNVDKLKTYANKNPKRFNFVGRTRTCFVPLPFHFLKYLTYNLVKQQTFSWINFFCVQKILIKRKEETFDYKISFYLYLIVFLSP